MVPSSRFCVVEGRAHPGTTTGRWYQVPAGTTPPRAVRASSRYPVLVRTAVRSLLVPVVVWACVACGGGPSPSFDPTGACVADGRAPGAYPELEALVPRAYMGDPPGTLDSGRNCSSDNLGPLAASGISEVRFAGGTWTFGAERAAVLAIFQAEGLDAGALAEFYDQGAQQASRTEITARYDVTVAGRPGRRLDTTTGGRTQTVVVWPGEEADSVDVVITNDLPDARIQDALDAFAGR